MKGADQNRRPFPILGLHFRITMPPTPSIQTPSALPFSVDLQLKLNKHLAHSFKNIGGMGVSVPKRDRIQANQSLSGGIRPRPIASDNFELSNCLRMGRRRLS